MQNGACPACFSAYRLLLFHNLCLKVLPARMLRVGLGYADCKGISRSWQRISQAPRRRINRLRN